MKQLLLFPLGEGFAFNDNILETNSINLSVLEILLLKNLSVLEISLLSNVSVLNLSFLIKVSVLVSLLQNQREVIGMTVQQAHQRAVKKAEQRVVDVKNHSKLVKRRDKIIRHQGKESAEREGLNLIRQMEKELCRIEGRLVSSQRSREEEARRFPLTFGEFGETEGDDNGDGEEESWRSLLGTTNQQSIDDGILCSRARIGSLRQSWIEGLSSSRRSRKEGSEEVIPQFWILIFRLWLYWKLWSFIFWSFFLSRSILLKKGSQRFRPYLELSSPLFYLHLLDLAFSPLREVIRQLWVYWRLWLLDFCIYLDLLFLFILKTVIFLVRSVIQFFKSVIQFFRSVIQFFRSVIQFWSIWRCWLVHIAVSLDSLLAPGLRKTIHRLGYHRRIPLLIICLSAVPLTSFYVPSWQFLSFLASYPVPVPFSLWLYSSIAFCIALILFYITDIRTRRYYSEIFATFLLLVLIKSIFPHGYRELIYVWVTLPSPLVLLPPLIERYKIQSLIIRRVVMFLLPGVILRPQLLSKKSMFLRRPQLLSYPFLFHSRLQFIPLHLIATGLLLISILSFQSLRLLFPPNFVGPLNGVLLVAFVYYLPILKMPYFFLSFPSIIQRTIASFLLLFVLSTPQLLIFVGAATATVLTVLLTPQTIKVNYVIRRLLEIEYADYPDATRFIRRLSWAVCTLFCICMVTNTAIHYPTHLRFVTYFLSYFGR